LLEFTHAQIELFHSLPVFANLVKVYSRSLSRTQKLFEEDHLAFPAISVHSNCENLFEENNQMHSISFLSGSLSQRSNRAESFQGKFTPVDLDCESAKDQQDKSVERPATVYATASNQVHASDHPSILINAGGEHLSLVIQEIDDHKENWQIKPEELKFIKPIGNGSSCEVWLGEYQQTQVAIKRQKASDDKAHKEFYRELNVLVNLRHPNLVTFMGACFENPLCIITEYCGGGDLFSLLHKKKEVFISWQQKVIILKEIAKGMISLHSNNFIHRDLKSLNVLLRDEIRNQSDQIRVKISDFGLSREFEEDAFMTGQLGTCHWMAPEVLSSSKYTTKADVYSFGIVMYEVITRETPYKGKGQEEIRTQVLMHGLRPDLNLVPPGCDKILKSLMSICWNVESTRRPSFDSVLGLLNRINFG